MAFEALRVEYVIYIYVTQCRSTQKMLVCINNQPDGLQQKSYQYGTPP